jgi:hypothetical protein
MTMKTVLGGAPSFAHLIGFGKPRAADDKPKGAPDEEAAAEESEEEETEGDDKDKKGKKAKKSKAEESDDPDKEGEDEEAEDKKPESKAADDDEDEAKKAKRAEARGRKMERERSAAIFACPAAGVRPDLAAQLAFHTSMTADQAIGVLTTAASGGRRGINDRMATTQIPNIGADPGPEAKGALGVAAQIIAADKKRRGEV